MLNRALQLIFKYRDFLYIGLIVVLFLYMFSCNNKQVVVNKPVLSPVEQKVDKKGTTYSDIKGTFYTKEEMKALTDSLSKASGKKNIGSVTVTVTQHDTIYNPVALYIDTTHGVIKAIDSTKDYRIAFIDTLKAQFGHFEFSLTPDTATYISSLKKHLFKPDEYEMSIYHTNKLFVPVVGTSYAQSVPKVIGCVGPFVGLGYNGKVIPVVGIGVTFNLWGIKRK